MGRFSVDRDLLSYEPNVFVDLPFAGQRKVSVEDGVLSGATVTSVAGGFGAIAAGDVVVLGGNVSEMAGYGVSAVTDDNTLVLDGVVVGLSSNSGLKVISSSFGRQGEVVHDELMRAIGIDVDDSEEELDDKAVVSNGVMRQLEVFGILASVYGAAISLVGENEAVREKGLLYQKRYEDGLNGARVMIDLDGDGQADVVRRSGVGKLVRE